MKAADELNFRKINGKPCRIMLQLRDPKRRQNLRVENSNVVIKNLPRGRIEARGLFEWLVHVSGGRIVSCKIGTDRNTGAALGYAFAQFSSAIEAKAAIKRINEANIDSGSGRVVSAELYKADKAISTVYIRGLPQSWTREEIATFFQKRRFGAVDSVRVPPSCTGSCFVRFVEARDAETAIRKLHNTSPFGRKLVVERAMTGHERRRRMLEGRKGSAIISRGFSLQRDRGGRGGSSSSHANVSLTSPPSKFSMSNAKRRNGRVFSHPFDERETSSVGGGSRYQTSRRSNHRRYSNHPVVGGGRYPLTEKYHHSTTYRHYYLQNRRNGSSSCSSSSSIKNNIVVAAAATQHQHLQHSNQQQHQYRYRHQNTTHPSNHHVVLAAKAAASSAEVVLPTHHHRSMFDNTNTSHDHHQQQQQHLGLLAVKASSSHSINQHSGGGGGGGGVTDSSSSSSSSSGGGRYHHRRRQQQQKACFIRSPHHPHHHQQQHSIHLSHHPHNRYSPHIYWANPSFKDDQELFPSSGGYNRFEKDKEKLLHHRSQQQSENNYSEKAVVVEDEKKQHHHYYHLNLQHHLHYDYDQSQQYFLKSHLHLHHDEHNQHQQNDRRKKSLSPQLNGSTTQTTVTNSTTATAPTTHFSLASASSSSSSLSSSSNPCSSAQTSIATLTMAPALRKTCEIVGESRCCHHISRVPADGCSGIMYQSRDYAASNGHFDDRLSNVVGEATTTSADPSVIVTAHQGEGCDDVAKTTMSSSAVSAATTPLFKSSSGWDNKNMMMNDINIKNKDEQRQVLTNLSSPHRSIPENLGILLNGIQGIQVSCSYDVDPTTATGVSTTSTTTAIATSTTKTLKVEERRVVRAHKVKTITKKHEQQQHPSSSSSSSSSCEALGNILFPLVSNLVSNDDTAPKITGMLLELKPREVRQLISCKERLESAIFQAETVLKKSSVPSPNEFDFASPPAATHVESHDSVDTSGGVREGTQW